VLLTGGVHGDEFEGPAALMRLLHDLQPGEVSGRVIILPALNAPALLDSSRVSPLDQANMNRAFPGDADGGPTQMLAHYIETRLLPLCDAAIDLHSGGKAAIFVPCVLTQADGDLGERNLALARAFGAPYIWLAGRHNDDRSVNAAAARQNVAMVAAELGGGGGCDPDLSDFAELALRRCLHHLGVTQMQVAAAQTASRSVEFTSPQQNFTAPAAGLFDRSFKLGDEVKAGQAAGWIHFVNEPQRPSLRLEFPHDGIVLALTNRGMVERGDCLALLAQAAVARAR
jgi:predicted deacylase